ncbi:MAG TPA: M28 family peptidase, partial [Bryobacteraceae bacterium]
KKLDWLREVTTAARESLPARIEAPLVFAGSETASDDLEGAMVVQLGGGGRGGLGAAGGVSPGAAGTLSIDSTGGPEPPRWPVAYSVAMSLPGVARQQPATDRVAFRFNPAYAAELFEGSGHTYKELMDLAAQRKPLPHFALGAVLRASMKVETGDIQSDNVVAVLPGSDPALANEYISVSAHLDGYGIGEPWNNDRIYNGAFDDAAYVATLIDLAENLQASHKKLRRPLLFLVVTAEEKGLLGSRYFTAHPTIPKDRIVANVNLDQLRPIFPLKTLTTLAVDESTMGDIVRQVGTAMGIRIQPDPEPERRLLTRSDHYSFMQIGVPAVGFIFGYEKGSPEEAIYRRWYADRYHSPADDLNQPWDPPAAAKFNEFFARVVESLANAHERPRWKPGSTFAK